MLLVKDGHLSELTALFDRYQVPLYNFFLRLTTDKATSEDLTQNLFLRVIRYRQSYDPSHGSFRSWVYRMARNVHYDFCKQEQKMPGRLTDPNDAEDRLADGSTGYTEDQFQRLDEALGRLSPEQKEILVLSRYQGLKYEEISRIKDISVAAIKVQVYRALKQLRTLYFNKN
ncbi:RNA polymerase sigma factor [Puia sp.]|jgi:RNA polymerase sigma-70 factor (ECF subfamily)|uniref:RNA polymerase sigma factor n=1 Tax=Puia sp. TaxID=2045100 RepID=UPI002F3E37F0